jgi:phage-related protein
MPTLPLLKSGQTTQYPLRRTVKQTVDTVAFLDGSEQRCAASRYLHEWTIQLGLIDEQELNALENFVEQQQGETGQFAFTDPADGAEYNNCSLAIQTLNETFEGPGRVTTMLVIRENPS